MSDENKNTKSALMTELETIVEGLNKLPAMARTFGDGILGKIIKFISKLVRKIDEQEARLARLEKSGE